MLQRYVQTISNINHLRYQTLKSAARRGPFSRDLHASRLINGCRRAPNFNVDIGSAEMCWDSLVVWRMGPSLPTFQEQRTQLQQLRQMQQLQQMHGPDLDLHYKPLILLALVLHPYP